MLLIELNLVINILHHVAYQAGSPEGLSPNRTSDPGAERFHGRDIGFFNLFTLIIAMLTYFMFFVAGRTVSLVFLVKSRPTAIQSTYKLKFVSMSLLMTSSLVGGLCYILGSIITIIFVLSRNSFNCDDKYMVENCICSCSVHKLMNSNNIKIRNTQINKGTFMCYD